MRQLQSNRFNFSKFLHQVGVPQSVAMSLTFPETVTHHNIARLRQNVVNGVHSGMPLLCYIGKVN